jgi:hypothetical protein
MQSLPSLEPEVEIALRLIPGFSGPAAVTKEGL